MSIIVAIFMVSLFVSMHECNARHTPGLGINKNNKDVAIRKPQQEQEIDTKLLFTLSENTHETFSGGESKPVVITLAGSPSPTRMQGLERRERSIIESDTHMNEEAAKANEDEPVEDVVVTDYVTPHRKSPIHNHH